MTSTLQKPTTVRVIFTTFYFNKILEEYVSNKVIVYFFVIEILYRTVPYDTSTVHRAKNDSGVYIFIFFTVCTSTAPYVDENGIQTKLPVTGTVHY